MIHLPIKQPKFNDTKCETLVYIDKEGKRITRPKRKFNTMEEAIQECFRVNAKPQAIHKVVPYKCRTCGKYHIGRNGKLIKK